LIITLLKDSYNGILGMPWIAQHGNSIDWEEQRFKTPMNLAVASAASSHPTRPLAQQLGNARIYEKGLCGRTTLAPLQGTHNISPLTYTLIWLASRTLFSF
jgi:hypothetical protein